jgi:hypothetical protein
LDFFSGGDLRLGLAVLLVFLRGVAKSLADLLWCFCGALVVEGVP